MQPIDPNCTKMCNCSKKMTSSSDPSMSMITSSIACTTTPQSPSLGACSPVAPEASACVSMISQTSTISPLHVPAHVHLLPHQLSHVHLQRKPNDQSMFAVQSPQHCATSVNQTSHVLTRKTMPEEDSDDESGIIEESPCGRWWKRREEVEQRDIPGLDGSFLAMDTEEGVEVVWNEVHFSERRCLQASASRLDRVFGRLVQLRHANIVRLHEYWLDRDPPRVVFITEYMASGSLKMFLKKTKKSVIKMSLCAWKRWCTQILCALNYLHSQKTPIIHANLNCDSIFISHNGLIKIGAVAPDAIQQEVKSVCTSSLQNMHTLAPELLGDWPISSSTPSTTSIASNPVPSHTNRTPSTHRSPAIDIYAFGVVALEMALLGLPSSRECAANGNSFSSPYLNRTALLQLVQQIDNPAQRDLIYRCLAQSPDERPSVRELLFHPVIFEVPSLRLLSAHRLLNTDSAFAQPESLVEEVQRRRKTALSPLALIPKKAGSPVHVHIMQLSKFCPEQIEKFMEEVCNGAHPLYALDRRRTSGGVRTSSQSNTTTLKRDRIDSQQSDWTGEYNNVNTLVSGDMACNTFELDDREEAELGLIDSCVQCADLPYTEESRRIVGISVSITSVPTDGYSATQALLNITLRLDDQMNRQLSCELGELDSPLAMTDELVFYGFIHSLDRDFVCERIHDALTKQLTGSCCTNPLCSPNELSCSVNSSSCSSSCSTLTGDHRNIPGSLADQAQNLEVNALSVTNGNIPQITIHSP